MKEEKEGIPQDDPAERFVLGAVLVEPERLPELRPLLQEADFYRNAHRLVFRAMLELHEKNIVPDTLTLSNHLKAQGRLEDVGGPVAISQLMDGIPRLGNIEHYAKAVVRAAQRRALLREVQEAAAGAMLGERDPVELASALGVSLKEVKARTTVRRESLIDQINVLMQDVHERQDGKRPPRGWSTGLISMDHLTGGLVPGRLIVLGARPKMGKSSFLLCLLRATAKQRVNSFFQSIEMPQEQCVSRIMAQEASVELAKFLNANPQNQMNDREWKRIVLAADRLKEVMDCVTIDYDASVTVADIKSNVWAAESLVGPIRMVYIDYLQRIRHPNPRLPRHEKVDEILWELAEWAKQEQRVIFAPAQIRRIETKEYSKKTNLPPRPRPSNLKESGGMEEHADQVILLDRNEVHLAEQDKPPGEHEGQAWVRVALNRHGPTESLKLRFWKETTLFTETEHERDEMPF